MENKKVDGKQKEEIENLLVDVIDEGSEKVTTLSEATEAKYESIGPEEPGKEPQSILKNHP